MFRIDEETLCILFSDIKFAKMPVESWLDFVILCITGKDFSINNFGFIVARGRIGDFLRLGSDTTELRGNTYFAFTADRLNFFSISLRISRSTSLLKLVSFKKEFSIEEIFVSSRECFKKTFGFFEDFFDILTD